MKKKNESNVRLERYFPFSLTTRRASDAEYYIMQQVIFDHVSTFMNTEIKAQYGCKDAEPLCVLRHVISNRNTKI